MKILLQYAITNQWASLHIYIIQLYDYAYGMNAILLINAISARLLRA